MKSSNFEQIQDLNKLDDELMNLNHKEEENDTTRTQKQQSPAKRKRNLDSVKEFQEEVLKTQPQKMGKGRLQKNSV